MVEYTTFLFIHSRTFLFLKIEIANKKNDYAERVKERNKLILAEQQAKDAESLKSSAKPPSKSQRVTKNFFI